MKTIRLNESDIKRIVKRVLTEQIDDIPEDVKMVYDKYLMSPDIDYYIFEDNWHDAKLGVEEYQETDTEEIIKMLAQGFTFAAATDYIYGEGFDDDYKREDEMSKKLLKYYDNEQIVRKVLDNINHPKKEEVFEFIDDITVGGISKDTSKLAKRRRGIKLSGNDLYKHIVDNYIAGIMVNHPMDDIRDQIAYYENLIGWGIEQYLEGEEPNRQDDWGYREELREKIKYWWQPI